MNRAGIPGSIAILVTSIFFAVPRTVVCARLILTRNTAPVLGAQLSPYLQKGEFRSAPRTGNSPPTINTRARSSARA